MRLCSTILVICLLFAAVVGCPVCAQEGDDSVVPTARPSADSARTPIPGEPTPVFVEIELTSEGAIAYDSSGGRWAYDFERLQFVAAPTEVGSERGHTEGGPEEQAAPVEVRCTELKEVENPALSAVFVNRDEYVDGDIVAYSRVTVKGWVKGSVRSVNKAVLVTSTGQVDGDVEAPEVEIRTGGRVLGQVTETPVYEIPVDVITSGFSKAGLWVVFGFTLALLLIAFLAVSLAPQRLTSMTDCVVRFPLKTMWVGLLFVFLLAPITFMVTITIIGILVVWLVPVAYFVAFAAGILALGYRMHDVIARMLGRGRADVRIGSILGIAVYMGLWTLTSIAWGSNSAAFQAGGLDVWLLVISILTTCYPLLVGVGAAYLTRFGSRVYVSRRDTTRGDFELAPAPAPPPMPQAPTRLEPRTPLSSSHGPLSRPEADPNDVSSN